MLTAYSRVTVVNGTRKVDLALPSTLPVADVVPQVMRYCVAGEGAGDPSTWSLARLGGTPLPLTQTLAEAGVLDGEILELRGRATSVRPALVEDVRDAIEDSVDAAGGWWRSRTTVAFALATGATTLAVLAVVQLLDAEALGADVTIRVVNTLIATVTALALTAWSAQRSTAWVTQACAVVLAAWAYLSGLAVGAIAGLDSPVVLLVATSSAAVAVAAARLVTVHATALAAAYGVLAAGALALGVVGLTGTDELHVARAAPVLALLATGVIPRLTLAVGGIASADYRIRHVGRLSDEALVARYRQSNGLLIGGLLGASLVVALSCTVLTFGNDWDRYLALSVGLVALLRSRVFSRVPHMVALRAAGAYVLALQLVRLADDVDDLRAWSVTVAAAAAVLLVAISSLTMSEITRARVKRVLNIVEFLVVVDMIVVALGALGLYAYVGGFV
ncbi:MAG: type VII secretion integral membrane protein EccD [Actinomycetota bacterium]|nr:type VII secretion integral membrane protein EccD [Actinomycetota bacterium]